MSVKAFGNKSGFGIVEVLISAAVLGFLYLALLNLQLGNRQSLLRIRGRDGAVEVAQQALDSMQRGGVASLLYLESLGLSDECGSTITDLSNKGANIPVADSNEVLFCGPTVERYWARGVNGDSSSIEYKTIYLTKPDSMYVSEQRSALESTRHVYARNVSVFVYWPFKSSIQSISISGVVR